MRHNRIHWHGHIKGMDRTRIPRRVLELKFLGDRSLGQHRTGWFSQVQEGIKKRGKSWQKIEKGRIVDLYNKDNSRRRRRRGKITTTTT
jgi:hypothetical protein